MKPRIAVYYDKEDANGRQVRGHERRVSILIRHWEKRFGKEWKENDLILCNRPDVTGNSDILFVDSWRSWTTAQQVGRLPLRVVYVDGRRGLSPMPADLLFSSSILPAPIEFGVDVREIFTGWSYYIGNPYLQKAATIRDVVLVCPGGNKDYFFKKVDVEGLRKAAREYLGCATVVLDGSTQHSMEDFALMLSQAKGVVTAAGQTMLEAMSLNKPTIFVETADDQKQNIIGAVTYNLASKYRGVHDAIGQLKKRRYHSLAAEDLFYKGKRAPGLITNIMIDRLEKLQ